MCAVLQLDSDEDRIYWDVWSEAIVYNYKTISHNMMTLNSITRFSVVRAWPGFTVTFEHTMTLPRNWMDFSPVWKLQLRQQVQQGSECNRVVMETQGYRSDGNTGFQVEFISSQDKPPPIQEMPSRALTQCAGIRNTGRHSITFEHQYM